MNYVPYILCIKLFVHFVFSLFKISVLFPVFVCDLPLLGIFKHFNTWIIIIIMVSGLLSLYEHELNWIELLFLLFIKLYKGASINY
jgi:hypothetical protein